MNKLREPQKSSQPPGLRGGGYFSATCLTRSSKTSVIFLLSFAEASKYFPLNPFSAKDWASLKETCRLSCRSALLPTSTIGTSSVSFTLIIWFRIAKYRGEVRMKKNKSLDANS
eukprot:TRINITY_DN686_c0_g1_i15.p1 TRINITY_DN686_c0_g1~~TRINITY_DN686_c0_g1_i15.p1  ORF type:complete len:114 (-),score=9.66 TRINITY_DN686_c0_g1_i15:634-975(-)